MTLVRRNVWRLGTAANPWHPVLLAYARAVRAMQALPIADPRSWAYQSAIHGLAGVTPPAGAPWNNCQHATWYFLPWHRMYLYQFERIVRSFVIADGGPADWALPYWNYELANQNSLPRPFRVRTLPDGTPNPLFVARRNGGTGANSINGGATIPSQFTTSAAAMANTVYTTPTSGVPIGFGGPRTTFAHFGPGPGELENQPHNIMHVVIGGQGGLMSDPDTAASDPIFWLHHANIDRLWETWRVAGNANPTTLQWTARTFRLRDENGATVRMRNREVVDSKAQLDYTYDSIRQVAAAPAAPSDAGGAMAGRRRVMVGRASGAATLTADGLDASLTVGSLPTRRRRRGAAADAADEPRRFHLELADVVGSENPGAVFGVYVNAPKRASAAELERHRVGNISLFGVEHTRRQRGRAAQPLRFVFDITPHVVGEGAEVQVTLRPLPGLPRPPRGAAPPPPVRVGTIAVHAT